MRDCCESGICRPNCQAVAGFSARQKEEDSLPMTVGAAYQKMMGQKPHYKLKTKGRLYLLVYGRWHRVGTVSGSAIYY